MLSLSFRCPLMTRAVVVSQCSLSNSLRRPAVSVDLSMAARTPLHLGQADAALHEQTHEQTTAPHADPLSPTTASVARHLRMASDLLLEPRGGRPSFSAPADAEPTPAVTAVPAAAVLASPPRKSRGWNQPLSPEELQQQLMHATRRGHARSRSGMGPAEVRRERSRQRAALEAQSRPAAAAAAVTPLPASASPSESSALAASSEMASTGVVLFDAALDAAVISPPTPANDASAAAAASASVAPLPPPSRSPSASPDSSEELSLHLLEPVADDSGAGQLASAIIASAPNLTSIRAFLQHVRLAGAVALELAMQTPNLALRVADMRFRDLTLDAAEKLCNSLAYLSRLESLTLRCCALGDAGASWLCSAFLTSSDAGRCSLLLLDLNENHIGDAGAFSIADLIEQHRTLTSLQLEENAITALGADAIGRAMRAYSGRQARQKASTDPPAASSFASLHTNLAPGAPHPSAPLTILPAKPATPFRAPQAFTPAGDGAAAAARRLEFTPSKGDQGAESKEQQHRTPAHSRNRSQRVSFGPDDGNRMVQSDEFHAAVSTLLSSTPASSAHASRRASFSDHRCMLQSLNLRFNKIDLSQRRSSAADASGSAGAAAAPTPLLDHTLLSRYLSLRPDPFGLSTLNLSLNQLGDEAASTLAAGLAYNSTLTRLQLSYCGISDRGGVALCRSLAFNSSLLALDLSLNALSTQSCLALSDALGFGVNHTIRELDLSSNELTDACCWSLCDALSSADSLADLQLHGNFIGADGAHALAQAIRSPHSSLTQLNVDNNLMGPEGERKIALALAEAGRSRRGQATHTPPHDADLESRRERMRDKIRMQMEAEKAREEDQRMLRRIK